MDTSVLAVLHTAGLDSLVPLILALHATASALDAILPQPAPGSHWLPLRKLLSIAAANVGHASNAQQPAMLTWIQRIAGLLVAMLPPAPPAPAPVVRVEPVGPAAVIIPAVPSAPQPPAPLFPPVPANPNP